MNQTQAIIERVRRVNDSHQRLSLAVDRSVLHLKPGHTLLVRPSDSWEPYLRQVWHPVTVERELLVVELPGEPHYAPGTVIDVIAPVGSPFKFRKTLRSILFVVHDTPPTPLLFALVPLLLNRIAVTLVLLGSARAYGTEHLPPEVEIVRGEGEGLDWPNRVTTVGWADQILVLARPDDPIDGFRALWAMFKTVRNEIPANTLFAVHNPIMPCGVGACGVCNVRMRDGTIAACTEGAAVDMTRMAFP